MYAFFAIHGAWLFFVLLGLGAVGGALVAAAWRWLRDPFRLVPPPPDARVLRGTVRTDDDFGAALTIAASTRKWGDLETASFRTRKMTLETPEGDYEVHGPVTVLGDGSKVRPGALPPELIAHAKSRVCPDSRWMFEEMPLVVRRLRSGDRVEARGRVERVADVGAGYRVNASRRVLTGGVAMARRPRAVLSGGIVLGVALGMVGAASLLALGAALDDHESRPSVASLLVPPRRSHAVARLSAMLLRDDMTEAEGALLLSLLPTNAHMERARTLHTMGRRQAATQEVLRGAPDPVIASDQLQEAGLHSEAMALIDTVHGRRARAREVLLRMRIRLERPRPPSVNDALRQALEETCDQDWTCAAHPSLFAALRRSQPSSDPLSCGCGFRRWLWHAQEPRWSPAELVAGRFQETLALGLARTLRRVLRHESRELARERFEWLAYLAAHELHAMGEYEGSASLAAAERALSQLRPTVDDRLRLATLRGLQALRLGRLDEAGTTPLLRAHVQLARAGDAEVAQRIRGLPLSLIRDLERLAHTGHLTLRGSAGADELQRVAYLAHLLSPIQRERARAWAWRSRSTPLASVAARRRALRALGVDPDAPSPEPVRARRHAWWR